jgi:hypothetical protein
MRYQLWCPKLDLLYNESYNELNINEKKKINIENKEDYAIYPKRLIEIVNKIPKIKKYDYCFIGAFSFTKGQNYGYNNRKWIIEYSKNNFTNNSFFVNTTKNKDLDFEWKLLGNYDYTFDNNYNFYVPKYMNDKNAFDINYYKIMCESKFCLTPAGDCDWSMRFYEALLCNCIPIVNKKNETFRSYKEKLLDYKYFLTNNNKIIYNKEWINHNYNLFIKYHSFYNL